MEQWTCSVVYLFCPNCHCPFLSWTHSSCFCVFVCFAQFLFLFLFAHSLFQASITAAATGSLPASVSNCDKILIFPVMLAFQLDVISTDRVALFSFVLKHNDIFTTRLCLDCPTKHCTCELTSVHETNINFLLFLLIFLSLFINHSNLVLKWFHSNFGDFQIMRPRSDICLALSLRQSITHCPLSNFVRVANLRQTWHTPCLS